MLMDWEQMCLKYDFAHKVTGILHCGAHIAEEAGRYAQLDVPVWWVEANPNLTAEILHNLAPFPKQHLISALLADVDGEKMTLHISGPDYRGSSSVLEWGTHKQFSPLRWVDHVICQSRTLDSLHRQVGFADVNMVVTDLQGMDGAVLRGGMGLLKQVDWIMSEGNVDEVYVGCMQLPEFDAMLSVEGFERVEIHLVGQQGWGDVLYRRRR
jgi:FkbM family methyltransferase